MSAKLSYLMMVSLTVFSIRAQGDDHGIAAIAAQETRATVASEKLNVSSKALREFIDTNNVAIKRWFDQGGYIGSHFSASAALIDGHDLITPSAMQCARDQYGVTLATVSLEQVDRLLKTISSTNASECTEMLKTSLNEASAWLIAREWKALSAMKTAAPVPASTPTESSLLACGAGYGWGAGSSYGGYYGSSFYGYGGYGAVSPGGRGYYGIGRYPLVGFRTPFRPWGGWAPFRQFFAGRGRIRRWSRWGLI